MKRLLLYTLFVTLFAACTQNEINEQSVNRQEVPKTLTVGFEGDDTRIQLQNGKTVWTKDDIVSVFYRSNANQKWQYQGETGERVGVLKHLESGVATRDLDNVVVVYPYNENYYINTETYNIEATLPAVQHYAEESYGVGENLMVSCDEDNQISLRNVCGWLKIQLTGNGERVQSIKLRGNNEEQLAGLIYVDTATAESTLASEMGSADDNNAGGNLVFDDTIVTELTLDCGEGVVLGAEATSFYFALPPQTFEGGFTVDVECEDSEPMAISTENRITIQRNHIQPMASIAFEGEEVIPYNEIHYTATAKVKANSGYPWSFDTFGADVVSHEWDSESGEGVITFDADVTTIGNMAFCDCDSLTSVTIPDSVTTIGEYAFSFCSSLTNVTIPDSVTTIGYTAFYDCNSLTSITIPDSVTTIGYAAFYDCNSLTSITIPDSVTTIGGGAFGDCDSLTEFNGKFASEDGRCLIIDSTLNSFAPAGLTSYTIPDSVTTIGEYAFAYCDNLTSITIPDSVTTIGEMAFYDCDSLTSITIPDSVTTIGENAFRICDSLTEFNGKFASEDGRCLIVDGTLNSFAPAGLTSYTIPDSVTAIGEWAFRDCDSLTSITIPDSITTIGYAAFYECNSITSITISDSVTTIEQQAFYLCTSLTSIYCKATTPPSLGYVAFSHNASERKIYVPAGSVEAYKSATYWSEYADAIVGYDFENGVVVEPEVSINNEIRYTATAKVEIEWASDTFGADVVSHEWDSESGEGVITFDADVTTIGDYAFFNCYSLTSVTIGDSVTSIGEVAFAYCSNLTEFKGKFAEDNGRILVVDGVLTAFAPAGITEYNIPDGVTSIGYAAFSSCTSLTSVTIPDSVTTIGEWAFSECHILTSVTIPDSVTTIGDYAFACCYSLTSVTIGDSVTTIGGDAFVYCDSLTSVYCEATTPPSLDGNVFEENASDRLIYVPAESVEAYKTADYWSDYADYIIGYDFENGEVVE